MIDRSGGIIKSADARERIWFQVDCVRDPGLLGPGEAGAVKLDCCVKESSGSNMKKGQVLQIQIGFTEEDWEQLLEFGTRQGEAKKEEKR